MRVLAVCGRTGFVAADSQQMLEFGRNQPDCRIQDESARAPLDTRERGLGRYEACGHVAATLGARASAPGIANVR